MIKTAAAALAASAALALAAPAHADAAGMAVNFQPTFGGINVTITEAGGAPKGQDCTYTSVSAGGLGSLVPPTLEKKFALAPAATVTLRLPGIPTGTTWQVIIRCKWQGADPPPLPGQPFSPNEGFFSDIVTY